jgi:hypothetical protein
VPAERQRAAAEKALSAVAKKSGTTFEVLFRETLAGLSK